MKRKFCNEAPVTYIGELSLMLAKNNDKGGDMIGFGAAKWGRSGDVGTEIPDGSGMAEAGFQRRRLQ